MRSGRVYDNGNYGRIAESGILPLPRLTFVDFFLNSVEGRHHVELGAQVGALTMGRDFGLWSLYFQGA